MGDNGVALWMDYKGVTVAETISRFRRRNGEPPNGVHLSDHKLSSEAMTDVGPHDAVNSASLRQTTKKVMTSHMRITIALTVQSMPRARSEKRVYDATRKTSMAFNNPLCGGFLEELELFFFFEEEDEAICCIWGNGVDNLALMQS